MFKESKKYVQESQPDKTEYHTRGCLDHRQPDGPFHTAFGDFTG